MILVIDKDKENADGVSDIFFYMGILSKGVSSEDAPKEIARPYRAAVLLFPESYRDNALLIKRLRDANNDIPIFAVSKDSEFQNSEIDLIITDTSYPTEILKKILLYTSENNLPSPGEYKQGGIDLSFNLPNPTYFSAPFSLTKTESMIIRYLIRAFPTSASSDEILKYSYRDKRMPESSNIRTHISVINKKFRSVGNKNLVESSFSAGYRIIISE